MKYIIRSIKYFFCLMVILSVLVFALVTLGYADANLETLFVNGYDSYWQIALLMAVFALIYPKLGFTSRQVILPGSFSETAPVVKRAMEGLGYILERQEGEDLYYKKSSAASKALKMWEDRISFTRTATGFSAEGLTRDLPRIMAAIEREAIR
ncbi:MAG: hypothetical protein KBS67_04645 [Bacteroidales bacterium]|nr:hypothetical protein [Candidatus Cryptobacteroides equifaecalis]